MEWHTQRQRWKQSCLTSIIPARHTGTRVLTLEITLTIRTLKPAFSSKIHFSCHFRCTDPVCMCVSTRPASSDYLIGSHFFSSHKFLLFSICFFKAADYSQGELGVFWPAKITSHHPDVCQETALDTCSRLSVRVRYGLVVEYLHGVGGRPGHVYWRVFLHLTISLNTLLPTTGN